MNSIEKKIDSIARSGSLVQPLLLEQVKERVQANPLTNGERKPAQKRRKVIVAIKAAASACAVFILCFFTFFLCLPLFMPANSAPPYGDSDGTPSPGSAYAYEDLIKYPLSSETDTFSYSATNGLHLAYLDRHAEFAELYFRNNFIACETEYNIGASKVTVIQTVFDCTIELPVKGKELVKSFDYETENLSVKNDIYAVSQGYLCIADLGDSKIYATITGADVKQAETIMRQLCASLENYLGKTSY